jgi:hypothetical protein
VASYYFPFEFTYAICSRDADGARFETVAQQRERVP